MLPGVSIIIIQYVENLPIINEKVGARVFFFYLTEEIIIEVSTVLKCDIIASKDIA